MLIIIHLLSKLKFSFQLLATIMSLRLLLDNDKLMGPNFDNWYRKLRIILEHDRILYMINDPTPEKV